MTVEAVESLIQRVAEKDQRAFRELYHRSSGLLLGVLSRMLGSRHEAEDALQEVFLRIWSKAHSFDPDRGRGLTWLVTIARYHAIDQRRLRRPADAEPFDVELVADTRPGADHLLDARNTAHRIVHCLDRLDPDHAAALRSAYLEGFSYIDLANRHGVPLNTIRSWLRRSIAKLRLCLED